jgi:hypothetical protein
MKAVAYFLLVLLLVVLPLSVPGYTQAPNDNLIVPGQRIGKWTLDMTIDDLVRMNGAQNANGALNQYVPVTLAQHVNPTYVGDVYLHAWHNLSFFVSTLGEHSQKVVYLAIFSKDYKTAEGLSLNTPPQNIEALYGRPTVNMQFFAPNSGSLMIYDQRGLAVRIFDSGTGNAVQVLIVFRPGTANQIWRIPASSVIGTTAYAQR